MININKFIDHTILNATATEEDIVRLCEEARTHNFYAVCVNGAWVGLARKNLAGCEVEVCAVVGFPLGATSEAAKVFEARKAIEDGAGEIDMVINIGAMRSKDFQKVEHEINMVKKEIGDAVLKVILETCYLSPEEVVLASEIAVKAKANFVKTSTGFGIAGASLEHIDLIKKGVDGKAKIKASGGIKNLDTALSYIEAGVDRIGTSSGVSIIKELKK